MNKNDDISHLHTHELTYPSGQKETCQVIYMDLYEYDNSGKKIMKGKAFVETKRGIYYEIKHEYLKKLGLQKE
jgi:hypothetical protein